MSRSSRFGHPQVLLSHFRMTLFTRQFLSLFVAPSCLSGLPLMTVLLSCQTVLSRHKPILTQPQHRPLHTILCRPMPVWHNCQSPNLPTVEPFRSSTIPDYASLAQGSSTTPLSLPNRAGPAPTSSTLGSSVDLPASPRPPITQT